MFENADKKNVVLGITGSIAAYKAPEIARQLVSWGYEVRCVMTKAAQEFITALTLQSVTGHDVMTDFWDGSESETIGHIELADWADVLLVAPATADFLAKMAAGFSDSPLLAVALATRAPVVVAPAMNVNMYEHQVTKENIDRLKARGVEFIDPEVGALACGWNGTGRLSDPWNIFWQTRRSLARGDYNGKEVLIVTGPTREAIDPVRYLSNRSSGKMGVALAREAFRRGANVRLIHGPIKARVPSSVSCVEVVSAQQMLEQVINYSFPKSGPSPDLIIMAAAVSDFRPLEVMEKKIKKVEGLNSIKLAKNPDILAELGKRRGDQRNPVLVGFAVETGEIEELIEEARRKLSEKGVDIIVGNFAQDAFELDTNRAWLVDRNGRQQEIATTYKSRVANKILDAVLKL